MLAKTRFHSGQARMCLLGVAVLLVFAMPVFAQEHGDHGKGHDEKGHEMKGHEGKGEHNKVEPYALDTCAFTGGKLGSMGEPVSKVYVGQEVQFCCAGCVGKFEKDITASLKKVNLAVAKRLSPLKYPLDVCAQTGGKLGGMGKPLLKTYAGREVKFCCAGCPKAFEKDLTASFKKLDATIIAKQKAAYPTDKCLVSGDKLGGMGKPIQLVSNNQLVQLCCKGCVGKFKSNPKKHLIILADAYLAKAGGFTCSMHPEIKQKTAGKCPKCGMNLISAKPTAAKK